MRPTEEQWAMLEEMRPHFCCIRIDSDYNFGWEVWAVPEDESAVYHQSVNLSGKGILYELAGHAIEAAYNNWKEPK